MTAKGASPSTKSSCCRGKPQALGREGMDECEFVSARARLRETSGGSQSIMGESVHAARGEGGDLFALGSIEDVQHWR